MKRNLFTLALVCAAILMTGCGDVAYVDSENIDQNNILQCYSATYDSQTQQLTCEAVYHMDNMSGSFVRLTGNSSITCDKEAMTFGNGKYFLGKSAPEAPDKLTFRYTNNDGKKFVNILKFKPIDIKSEHISLTSDAENTISFKGKKANEYDRFFLILKQDDQDELEIEAAEVNGNELIFSAADLSTLPKGTFDAQFSRRSEGTDVKAADRGGFWKAEYLTVLKKVTIK